MSEMDSRHFFFVPPETLALDHLVHAALADGPEQNIGDQRRKASKDGQGIVGENVLSVFINERFNDYDKVKVILQHYSHAPCQRLFSGTEMAVCIDPELVFQEL
jgi:hypothetical protein